MRIAAPQRWAAGLAVATTLVFGTAPLTSASAAPPEQVENAAANTTLVDYPRTGHPNLYTRDVDRLSRFYQQLGFTEIFRFAAPGGPVAFATLQNGPFYLTMSNLDVIRDATGLRVLGTALRKQTDITVIVSDVDATVARLRSSHTWILMPPKDQPWGERQAYVVDPDGGLVQLSTHNG